MYNDASYSITAVQIKDTEEKSVSERKIGTKVVCNVSLEQGRSAHEHRFTMTHTTCMIHAVHSDEE